MAINNHFLKDNHRKLDRLLRKQAEASVTMTPEGVYSYAQTLATIENALVVVSDLKRGESRIFSGSGLSERIGLKDYDSENSIWEREILSLMSEEEQEEKFIAELRFFHFLRHLPAHRRKEYFLMSRLRFLNSQEMLHRMYYVFDDTASCVLFAICIYSPLYFDFPGKSHVVDSTTGIREELTSSANDVVLSRRECQILRLVASGMKSSEIAEALSISKNTVSRHRQDILARLQVKNSVEACRIARSMGIL